MGNWIKIALRNLYKNKRRSAATLIAIGIGFAAISLFSGYTDRIYEAIRSRAIQGEGLGHLTIYKQGWLDKGRFEPAAYMFNEKEINAIIALTGQDPEVLLSTPQLNVSGLASNGQVSTIFIGHGVVPEDFNIIRGDLGTIEPDKGEMLSGEKSYGVEMSLDLADILKLGLNQDGVIMGTTLDGQMNAMDFEVSALFDTGASATNDKFIRLPLPLAQSFYDTHSADRIVLLLKDWTQTDAMRQRLTRKLAAAGLPCEIKTWRELSQFYLKVKGMFDLIFMFILLIVMIIVVMSIVNTMAMTVVERTREIGTLRAIGLKRRGVNMIFSLEGMMLGAMGCVLGGLINTAVRIGINAMHITYVPPGNSAPVPLIINFMPQLMLALIGFMVVLALISAVIPARRAAKQNVVLALGHS